MRTYLLVSALVLATACSGARVTAPPAVVLLQRGDTTVTHPTADTWEVWASGTLLCRDINPPEPTTPAAQLALCVAFRSMP